MLPELIRTSKSIINSEFMPNKTTNSKLLTRRGTKWTKIIEPKFITNGFSSRKLLRFSTMKNIFGYAAKIIFSNLLWIVVFFRGSKQKFWKMINVLRCGNSSIYDNLLKVAQFEGVDRLEKAQKLITYIGFIIECQHTCQNAGRQVEGLAGAISVNSPWQSIRKPRKI